MLYSVTRRPLARGKRAWRAQTWANRGVISLCFLGAAALLGAVLVGAWSLTMVTGEDPMEPGHLAAFIVVVAASGVLAGLWGLRLWFWFRQSA